MGGIWSEVLAGLAGLSIPVAAFGGNWILKRTPEAKSPSEVVATTLEHVSSELEKTSGRLDRAYEQIEEERQNRRTLESDLNSKIGELNRNVERLWNNTVHLKRHIIILETTLDDNAIEIPIRPPEIDNLF